jgi:hypothetical protein
MCVGTFDGGLPSDLLIQSIRCCNANDICLKRRTSTMLPMSPRAGQSQKAGSGLLSAVCTFGPHLAFHYLNKFGYQGIPLRIHAGKQFQLLLSGLESDILCLKRRTSTMHRCVAQNETDQKTGVQGKETSTSRMRYMASLRNTARQSPVRPAKMS